MVNPGTPGQEYRYLTKAAVRAWCRPCLVAILLFSHPLCGGRRNLCTQAAAGTMHQLGRHGVLRAGGEFYCLFVQEGNVFRYSGLLCVFTKKPVFYAYSFCNLPSHCYKAKSARFVNFQLRKYLSLCSAAIECVRACRNKEIPRVWALLQCAHTTPVFPKQIREATCRLPTRLNF